MALYRARKFGDAVLPDDRYTAPETVIVDDSAEGTASILIELEDGRTFEVSTVEYRTVIGTLSEGGLVNIHIRDYDAEIESRVFVTAQQLADIIPVQVGGTADITIVSVLLDMPTAFFSNVLGVPVMEPTVLLRCSCPMTLGGSDTLTVAIAPDGLLGRVTF